jgi:hypothetical protein
MNSLFFNPLARPDYYYDPETWDYVAGNPPDGSMEVVAPCAECCECPSVTVERKSRSASKTKCGFSEFSGFASSPPKRYLTDTWSGTSESTNRYDTCSGTVQQLQRHTASGSVDFSSGCVGSGSITFTSLYESYDRSGATTSTLSYTDTLTPSYVLSSLGVPGSACPTSSGYTTTSTTKRANDIACSSPDNFACTGGITSTLSSEYTTATLISSTVAALPAYGAFSVASPSASRNLSTDELSYAIAEAVYRFRFKVPKVGSGSTYIIKWVERFSPEGGGAVTDTVKNYTWSGTIPGGYDATDSATWPISDEFTLAVPATDGTVAIACITVTCSGTAPADPCNP